MGLFKSKDERRVEREMKLKAHLRSIERAIKQQDKFSADFIKSAQHAQKIGDNQQYAFVRNALKRTATVKRMLERQVLAMKNAMLISQQAQASQQFAASMQVMSKQIGSVFGDLNLTKTQVDWEKAMSQAGTIEERMELFLDSMETGDASAVGDGASGRHHGRRDRPDDSRGRAGAGKGGTGQARRVGKRNRERIGRLAAERLISH